MASLQKRSRPLRIRHRIETECETEAEKEALSRRLVRVRQLLSPDGSLIDNGALLNKMFDIVERVVHSSQVPSAAPAEEAHGGSFMKDSGMRHVTCTCTCTCNFMYDIIIFAVL